MRAAVAFASTSGSTRAVAGLIVRALSPRGVDVLDLSCFADWGQGFDGRIYDLVFLGTPTYGTGDWHYCWERHGADIVSRLDPLRPVALFALGDARGHADSFAGGLSKLHDLCEIRGLCCLGETDPARFSFRSSPSVIAGRFPGLVLNYRREHRSAEAAVRDWVARLVVPAGA